MRARPDPVLLAFLRARPWCGAAASTAAASIAGTERSAARQQAASGGGARALSTSTRPAASAAAASAAPPPHNTNADANANESARAPPPPAQARWVFLGPPGVGKGTYASRVAAALGVAHVAAGDIVRAEIKAGSPLGLQAREAVAAGRLLPDALVLALVRARLAALAPGGYLLDGFPRTLAQAEALYAEGEGGGGGSSGSSGSSSTKLPSSSSSSSSLLPALAVNLSLREEVLVDKCVGRRVCGACGKGFNVADIRLAASPDGSRPEIVMPPLSPPPECAGRMETREDDTEPVVRRRLAAYHAEAGPVEAFFERRGALLDFEITGGIPQTLPRLARALAPYHSGGEALLAGAGGSGGGGGGGVVDKQKRDKAECGDKQAAARAAAAGG